MSVNFATEHDVFQWIWYKSGRPHNCVICDNILYFPEFWCFAHILSKGTYRSFKLRPKNIALMCEYHHKQWDQHTDTCWEDPNWQAFIEVYHRLKQQYVWYRENKLLVDYRITLINAQK